MFTPLDYLTLYFSKSKNRRRGSILAGPQMLAMKLGQHLLGLTKQRGKLLLMLNMLVDRHPLRLATQVDWSIHQSSNEMSIDPYCISKYCALQQTIIFNVIEKHPICLQIGIYYFNTCPLSYIEGRTNQQVLGELFPCQNRPSHTYKDPSFRLNKV